MANDVQVRIDQAALSRMLSDPSHATGRYMFALGNRIRNRAIQNAPVDTGRLRSSITLVVEGDPPDSVRITVGSDVEYARYVHDGTRYMTGRPFLVDAMIAEVGAL